MVVHGVVVRAGDPVVVAVAQGRVVGLVPVVEGLLFNLKMDTKTWILAVIFCSGKSQFRQHLVFEQLIWINFLTLPPLPPHSDSSNLSVLQGRPQTMTPVKVTQYSYMTHLFGSEGIILY